MRRRSDLLRIPVLLALLGLAGVAAAQTGIAIPQVNVGVGAAKNPNEVSTSLQILALLTVLSVAPAIMILTTAFTRIVIIFSLLRSAMGTQSIPPNQVIIGLSLFLTFYVMAPTYTAINDSALQPFLKKQISMEQAIDRAEVPMRRFMLRNTYSRDLKLFLDMRRENATPENVSMLALIPAFIISELKTAFVIGFYVFVPFVIIDLIVASVLMSLGMMMMPPVVVSLPAKILVFILADGWSVLVSAIMAGYL